jgi:hypothetical protein
VGAPDDIDDPNPVVGGELKSKDKHLNVKITLFQIFCMMVQAGQPI